MKTTKEQRKEQAVKAMKMLDIYEPYIKGFIEKDHIVFAYVWNKDDDYCSEFGSIGVRSFGGGIRRVG